MHALELEGHSALGRASYLLLHETPGRCRIRVARMRADASVRERVSHRLANSPLVSSFRLNPACESVTIEHLGQVDALMDWLSKPSTALAVKRDIPPHGSPARAGIGFSPSATA